MDRSRTPSPAGGGEQESAALADDEGPSLPEKYRAVIVACDLEERSRETCPPPGAVGRDALQPAARGLPAGPTSRGPACRWRACPGGARGRNAARRPLLSLTAATVKWAVLVASASGAVPRSVGILMKGALQAMFLAKMKLVVGALMILAALGASSLVYRASGQSAAPPRPKRGCREASWRAAPRDELTQLNLEVVLEKVRTQEARSPPSSPTRGRFVRRPSPRRPIIATVRQDGLSMRSWDVVTGAPGEKDKYLAGGEEGQHRAAAAYGGCRGEVPEKLEQLKNKKPSQAGETEGRSEGASPLLLLLAHAGPRARGGPSPPTSGPSLGTGRGGVGGSGAAAEP